MKNAVISESPAATVRKLRVDHHVFVVENYSGRKGIGVGNPISSDEFELCGYRWIIRFFPEGQDDESHNGGYASAYVSLRSESALDVRLMVSLHIVDQVQGYANYCGVSSFLHKKVSCLSYRDSSGISAFISRAKLESPDSGYLKDDSLKFSLSIGVFTYHIRNRNQNQQLPVYYDFEQLLERQWQDEFAFFHVAQNTYCAAKSILAARCPALLSRLPDDHHLQDAIIPDVDPNIFMTLLWFVYKGTLSQLDKKSVQDSDPENLESFAAKLLRASDKFELKGLKEICQLSLLEKVSRESVVSLLRLADVCNAAQLKSACLKFAAKNQSVIMESDGCERLKETCPLLYLELMGFGDNSSFQDYTSSINGQRVLNMCNRVISTVRESLVISHWPCRSPYTKHKMKEF